MSVYAPDVAVSQSLSELLVGVGFDTLSTSVLDQPSPSFVSHTEHDLLVDAPKHDCDVSQAGAHKMHDLFGGSIAVR